MLRIFILVVVLFVVGLSIALYISSAMVKFARPYWINNIDNIDKRYVVLVLGARVYKDGKLSTILRDRVDLGIELYKKAVVSKLLFSGAHHKVDYDEVNAMKNYALSKGVLDRDIFLDHAGLRTYDSLYRAKAIFGLGSFYVITQKFHLDRAIYIARHLGLNVYGIPADKRIYDAHYLNKAREFLARIKAYFELHIFNHKPKHLGPKIDIKEYSDE